MPTAPAIWLLMIMAIAQTGFLMLKLYHYPISPNSRRVWVALLEKQLEFELVSIELNGAQFQPDFLALNPFHHIPVLVDDDFRVIESLAILDYLEAKYPTPSLLPSDAKTLATVRMVEMVTINELMPNLMPLMRQWIGQKEDPKKIEETQQKVATVLTFFEQLLGEQSYFAGDQFTLAEVVAGTVVPSLPFLGISLSEYPRLSAWAKRLNQRPSWSQTQTSPEEMEAFKSQLTTRMTAK